MNDNLLTTLLMMAVFFSGVVVWLRYEGRKFDRKYGPKRHPAE